MIGLPLVLPPVVTGYLLLLAFGRRGIFGSWLADIGIVFSFRWTGAALACARRRRFRCRSARIRLSIKRVDRKFEDAAGDTRRQPRLDADSPSPLPLALPGISSPARCWPSPARSGEFGATITFVSNIPGETQTISAAIYTLTQVPVAMRRRSSWSASPSFISLVALIVSEWFGRRAGARVHGIRHGV